jgi:beta-glucosidase
VDWILAVVGDALPFIGELRSTATLELPGRQAKLLDCLLETGKPVVVVIVASKPLVLPERLCERAAAVLCAWNPGCEGGEAILDLLDGSASPSGRLPMAWPRHAGQLPIYYAQPRGQHGSTYADLPQSPLFPFGFGLHWGPPVEYSDLILAEERLPVVALN